MGGRSAVGRHLAWRRPPVEHCATKQIDCRLPRESITKNAQARLPRCTTFNGSSQPGLFHMCEILRSLPKEIERRYNTQGSLKFRAVSPPIRAGRICTIQSAKSSEMSRKLRSCALRLWTSCSANDTHSYEKKQPRAGGRLGVVIPAKASGGQADSSCLRRPAAKRQDACRPNCESGQQAVSPRLVERPVPSEVEGDMTK